MVRSPTVDSNGIKKGAWSEEEDKKLLAYVQRYGHWNWRQLPKFADLKRCGKSCRLRYLNYLKPGLKKGAFSKEEEELLIKLHQELGNKWSAIAKKLPGRTDNEIKNYWNSHLKKQMQQQDSRKTHNTNNLIRSTQESYELQDSSISGSISGSITTTDTLNQEISSPKKIIYDDDQEISYSNFNSEELVCPKFFDSFWTEPFHYPSNYNNKNNDYSSVLDLEFQDLIIGESDEFRNGRTSFSTNETVSDHILNTSSSSDPFSNNNSQLQELSSSSSSVDVLGDLCWSSGTTNGQPPEFLLNDYNYTVSLPPVVEEGTLFPFSDNNLSSSSLQYYYHDIDDLFNQF